MKKIFEIVKAVTVATFIGYDEASLDKQYLYNFSKEMIDSILYVIAKEQHCFLKGRYYE